MFNGILLLLVTLSLCAIYASAAPKRSIRRQTRSSYEDTFDVKSENEYQTIGLDNEDESPEIVLLDDNIDDSRRAREVAEVDYVPPPKHAYETGNGELSQQSIGTSQVDDVEKIEDPEYSLDEMETLAHKLMEEEQRKREESEAEIMANEMYPAVDNDIGFLGNTAENDQKTIETSQIDVDNVDKESENAEATWSDVFNLLLSNELEINTESEPERLADLEAPIIPYSKDASDQLERDEESNFFATNDANSARQKRSDVLKIIKYTKKWEKSGLPMSERK